MESNSIESDWTMNQEFLARCEDGSLTDDNPVVRMVRKKANMARRWGWANWVDDLEQETLIELMKGKYRGDGPLEGYIAHIMGSKLIRHWQKEHADIRGELPAEVKDGSDFAEKLEAGFSDRTKRLIARSPKHLWWFIETIVEADDYLSERDLAEIGKITRYRVTVLRKELRQVWEAMELADRARATSAGEKK
jgi:hypothetical protein